LRRLVDEFKKQHINHTTVVAGYKSETIDTSGIKLRINKEYETTGELNSLLCAREDFHDNMIIIYGDLLFRGYILADLLETSGEIVIVVDSTLESSHISGSPDYVYCSKPDDRGMFSQDIDLLQISESMVADIGKHAGRWIGMLRVQGKGLEWLNNALNDLQKQDDFSKLTIPDLLNYLVKNGLPVKVHYIHGHWLDVNTIEDIDRAGDFTKN
jgi:phosphoenolpyruvate phosphomutase